MTAGYPTDQVPVWPVNEQLTDWPDSDADDEEEDADEEQAHTRGETEVLTEDQYNRRVPHIKYYNWRDAEKAVASAHRTRGLPLDTFVVFAGLTYGDGEGALASFFRGAWSGAVSLPIYDDGTQCVPMIHVCDVATLTRKILTCPLADFPQPRTRYIFATDGARLSWRAIMSTIREMFERRRRTPILAAPSAVAAARASSGVSSDAAVVSSAVYSRLEVVPPAEEVLHHHVELFTVNLRVESETAAALMERAGDGDDESSEEEDETRAREGVGSGASPHPRASSLWPRGWVAPGGLRRNMERVSLEFCVTNRVTPLRLVLLGPPRVGKTRLSVQLSKRYKLVRLTMQGIVHAYQLQRRALQEQLVQVRADALRAEVSRRAAIKRQRVIRAARWRALRGEGEGDATSLSDPSPHASDSAANVDQDDQAVSPLQRGKHALQGDDVNSAADDMNLYTTQLEDEAVEQEIALNAEEMSEAQIFVEDRLEHSPAMAAMRQTIGEMERVLLMRIRTPEPTPEANTKRRMAQPKKKLTKEQQRKKEEEELLLAKEAIRNAPFQNKGLALMTRWRLDLPDCRNQGYILDGLPPSVELARMCFGSDELRAPETEEEALAQPKTGELGGEHRRRARDDEDEREAADEEQSGGWLSESCDESRLPDHVIVLNMPDSEIVDRLTAAAEERASADRTAEAAGGAAENAEDGAQAAAAPPGANREDTLNRFYDELRRFREARSTPEYSVFDFFRSAITVPGSVTAGGRRVKMHDFAAAATTAREAGVPASSLADEDESTDDSPTTDAITNEVSCVIGQPHNLGKTPDDVFEEEVRALRAQMKRQQREMSEEDARRERETAAFDEESRARTHIDDSLRQLKQRDLKELEMRKAPLRDYLLKNVIPLLNKGLIDVCTRCPDDPIDHLAEWLLRHNPNSDTIHDL